MEVTPLRFTAGQHHTLNHCLLSDNCSELFKNTLCLVLLLVAGSVFSQTTAFITTWKTDNPGTSNSTSITIPTTGTGYLYDVDWNNDGIFEQTGITGSVTRNFVTAGTYTVRIRGNFPRIFFNNGGDRQKLLNVNQWGAGAWTSMLSAFFGCTNLNITAADVPNLSGVTTMANMFRGCTSLNGPANIGNWNTGTVTDMNALFAGASAFSQPIGTWNTGLVTNMSNMFNGASAFNQPIGTWNTAKVTNMSGMFGGAIAFNQPIGTWSTAAVTNMSVMFFDAIAFNQPIGTLTLNAAVNLTTMLDNCGMDCSNYSATLIAWSNNPATPNTRSLGATGRKFETNAVAARTNLDITKAWTIAGDALVSPTFFADADGDGFGNAAVSQSLCSGIAPSGFVANSSDCNDANANINPNATEICNAIDDDCDGNVDEGLFCPDAFITTWKTNNPGTSNSTSITIPTTGTGYLYDVDWNNDGIFEQTGITGSVTHNFVTAGTYTVRIRGNFPRIFFNNGGDRQKLLNVNQWGGIAWTSMLSAFWGCANLNITATDVPNLSGVTNTANMFASCTSLNGPANIGTWNMATVTDMRSMFHTASAFNQPIGTWNTAAATLMSTVFFNATSFNQPIGAWNTAAMTTMAGMFSGATAFNQPLNTWTLNAAVNLTTMLDNCGIDCSNYSATLIGWRNNPATPNSRSLGATGRKFETNAVAARTFLDVTKAWTFTGDAITTAFFADADGDGFGNAAVSQSPCSGIAPIGFVTNSTDCNDANPNIHPGANEICNGIDDDCDGMIDEGFTCIAPFITTWKTDNPSTSSGTSITIPTTGTGYNYEVDWNNDGIYEQTGITGNVTHDFGTPGTYTIRLRGNFPRIFFNNGGERLKLLGISQWGGIAWTSMLSAFWGCSNLNITATDVPNLSRVTDMSDMFRECSTLNGPSNIGSWNTAKVTDMRNMFLFANAFNQPIGTWNTAAVTNMGFMFARASAFNQPIGTWNTAGVNYMRGMFSGASAFNQPIGTWTLNPVVDLANMLDHCGMNCTNYSATLVGWNANPTTPGNLRLGAISRRFETNAVAARTNLTVNRRWVITDDGLTTTFFQDADGDGFGNAAVSQSPCSGIAPIGFVSNSTDCNDANPNIHPGANEICNGIDDDCDGQIDENRPRFFADADGDGFGNAAVSQNACLQPSGFVTNSRDCDDTNPNVHPNATEICNGIDDDCDGQIDENFPLTFFADADGDGFGNAAVSINTCSQPSGFVANSTDCDDTNANIRPNATEICNGIDDNCDGTIDGFSCMVPFITTWKTDNPGTSNGTSITIPTTGTGYLYDADWNNDGIYEQTGITGSVTHNFVTAGTYTVRIRGNFPRIFFNNGGDRQKLLNVNQWGGIAWTDMFNAFLGCSNLNITATDVPNLSGVTITVNMFAGCTSLNGPANIGTWNMATVTDMRSMFRAASAFNQPIGTWNTANVTKMSQMFSQASSFNQPIGTWNTAAVTDMSQMFGKASSFNQPIGTWNTAAVTDMQLMFESASAFNQSIANWNTAAVTNMSAMFLGASAFNRPIGTWTLNPSVNLVNMLVNCGMDCDKYAATLIGWNDNPATPNARTLSADGRQYNATAVAARTNLTRVKGWSIFGDTEGGCIWDPSITTWKTDNPGTSNNTSITIPTMGSGYKYTVDWNNDGIFDQTGITGSITHDFGVAGTYTIRIRGDFPRIFFNNGGDRLKLLEISHWGDNFWQSMEGAFSGCSNLNITATDAPNLSEVTSLANMFNGCSSLNGPANIGTWNTSAIKDMSGMFNGATAFNRSLGTWKLDPSVNLANMLNNCGMDCNNYGATLIGWNNNPVTPNNRSLGAVGRKFGNSAVAARTNLTVAKGWTITGDAAGDCPLGTCANSILTNPGFENDASNWTFSGNSVDIVSNQVHSGQKAARINGNSGSGYQNKPASAGQAWWVSVWAKNNGSNTDSKIVALRFLDAGGAVLATFSKNVPSNTNDYTEFTILNTAPAGTAAAQVYFSKGQGGGTMYVDDWCLSQTTLPAQTMAGQQSSSQKLDIFENKNGQKNADISRFLVYPNPTDNVLNIRCLGGKAVSTEVSVLNAFGQKVFSQKLEIAAGGDNQLQVGDLPDGIYFLSVPSDSNLTKPTNIRFMVLKK